VRGLRDAGHNERSATAFMTHPELLAVLKVARQRRTRDWCMFLLAYRHGLRTTEVCSLKLREVENGTLSVQRRKGSGRTVQSLCPHPQEPLLDEIEALQAWLRVRRDDGSKALFTSQKGGALDRCQFFRIFQSAAKAAGLSSEKRHPRLLKYSLASHLLARNAGVTLVSNILGHRSVHSTLQYLKPRGTRVAERALQHSKLPGGARAARVAFAGGRKGGDK